MRLSKDSTVGGVVVSLLVAIFLLIPLSVVLNRISLESNQGFNLAEVFAYSPRGLRIAQQPIAELPENGAPNETAASVESEIESASSKVEDLDGKNSSTIAPVVSGNQTLQLEGPNSDHPSNRTSQSVDPPAAFSPRAFEEFEESEKDGDRLAPNENSTITPTPDPTISAPPTPLPSQGDGAVVASPVATSSSTSEIPYQNSINRGEAKQQRVFQPASLPHFSFVKFSAYRQSLHTFFVTGITSYVARTFDKDKIAHTCEWHPADGTLPMTVHKDRKRFVETKACMIYMKSDENHGTYSPTVINCTFAKEVGGDRNGGLLVLRISTGYDRWEPNLPVVAMEEQPGEVDIVMTPPHKLPFKYAFCGAPIHGKVRADWILQWMTYHHFLAEGKGHFFFYNMGGLAEADKLMFARFLNAGLLSITDILDPNLKADYPTWYYHQVLLINDCLHRSRFMAERVFFFDYDEFLQIPAPNTLSDFMSRHKDQPWISFGSIYANTHDCRSPEPGGSEAPVERMLWRRPAPECREKFPTTNPWLCIGPLGRRKYVVNPRVTFAGGVHWALIPGKGLNLLGNEARMLHYRSAPLPKVTLCAKKVNLTGEGGKVQEKAVLDDGWVRDDSVSKIYSKAKTFLGGNL